MRPSAMLMYPVASTSSAGSRSATAYQTQPTRQRISRRAHARNPAPALGQGDHNDRGRQRAIGRNSMRGISPAA